MSKTYIVPHTSDLFCVLLVVRPLIRIYIVHAYNNDYWLHIFWVGVSARFEWLSTDGYTS